MIRTEPECAVMYMSEKDLGVVFQQGPSAHFNDLRILGLICTLFMCVCIYIISTATKTIRVIRSITCDGR